MPYIPPGIATVLLTGRYIRPDGTPLRGTVTFDAPSLTLSAADTITVGSAKVVLDEDGAFSLTLIATDTADMQPTDWAYKVTESFTHAAGRTYAIMLPQAAPVVDLADIAPADSSSGDYILLPGPPGPAGAKILTGTGAPAGVGVDGDLYVDVTPGVVTLYGPKASGAWPSMGVSLSGGNLITAVNDQTGDVHLSADDVGADPAGAASAAIAAHASATDPHGDRAWAAGAFLDKTVGGTVNGNVTVTGTLTANSLVLPAGSVTSSKTAVFPAPTGAVSYVVWRAAKPCTVVAVRGYRAGGTGVTLNASKNGTADLLATDLSLSTDATWLSGATVQNASFVAGDSLVMKLTGVTGTPSAVTVQVDVQAA